MTKQEVLETFAKSRGFIPPDAVWKQLRGLHHRSSIYSYLFRLHKQGLLYRQAIQGRIAYQISQRGIERLNFFRNQGKNPRREENASGRVRSAWNEIGQRSTGK
jgi:DNA-binding PadR family transcriptional regulator